MDKLREGWITHPDGIEHVRVLGNARRREVKQCG